MFGAHPLNDDPQWWQMIDRTKPLMTSSHPYTRQPNRWYYREGPPDLMSRISESAGTVLAHENKHAYVTPVGATDSGHISHTTFSNYDIKTVINRDIHILMEQYSRTVANTRADELYGPFDQLNINIASEKAHNREAWHQAWKQYTADNSYQAPRSPGPRKHFLYQLAQEASHDFEHTMNKILNSLDSKLRFHLVRHNIFKFARSSVTGYLRYTLIVSLTQEGSPFILNFILDIYSNQSPNADSAGPFILGNAKYIGTDYTHHAILPDPHQLESEPGRALHPLYAEPSEIIPENDAHQMFLKGLRPSPLKNINWVNDKMPPWFTARNPIPGPKW